MIPEAKTNLRNIAIILLGILASGVSSFGGSALSQKPGPAASRLIAIAEAEARAAEPPVAAGVLFALGYSLTRTDRATAARYLKESYELIQPIGDSEKPGIAVLKQDVVLQAAEVAPDFVEQNLGALGTAKDIALRELVSYYARRKSFDHALLLLEQMDAPQDAAGLLLGGIRDQLKPRVFSDALSGFKRNPGDEIEAGSSSDLGELVVRYWRTLPGGLVKEAIDTLLADADPANGANQKPTRAGAVIMARTQAGAVKLGSYYEFRLFQLLPILRKLDPSEATHLMGDHAQIKPLIEKYGESTTNTSPPGTWQANTNYAISYSDSSATTAMRDLSTQGAVARSLEIAGTDFDRGLTFASDISDPVLRAQSLLALAKATVSKNRDHAKAALTKLLSKASTTPDSPNWGLSLDAASLSASLGESKLASDFLQLSNKDILRLYKLDSDPDDPNRALKFFWPSTMAWSRSIEVASRIDFRDANVIVDRIPDTDIVAIQRAFLAGYAMGSPVWQAESPIVARSPK